MTKSEFELSANKFLFMTRDELAQAWNNPGTCVLDTLVISLILQGVSKGDAKSLGFLLDRILGPVNQLHLLAREAHDQELSHTYAPISIQELEIAIGKDPFGLSIQIQKGQYERIEPDERIQPDTGKEDSIKGSADAFGGVTRGEGRDLLESRLPEGGDRQGPDVGRSPRGDPFA